MCPPGDDRQVRLGDFDENEEAIPLAEAVVEEEVEEVGTCHF